MLNLYMDKGNIATSSSAISSQSTLNEPDYENDNFLIPINREKKIEYEKLAFILIS